MIEGLLLFTKPSLFGKVLIDERMEVIRMGYTQTMSDQVSLRLDSSTRVLIKTHPRAGPWFRVINPQ